ncbi:hypothetical protein PACTADRAFT_46327 [Pachysolen tannophilus NRRL Y-2460]|uniref:NADH-ubiquinone oxidoreductase n=1 Tax=Pachysolen tannophilus NRRL Y-2460 TaxID=669874 RepID=A0A1E4TP30_PACTA|nr:hypothetical protein PACTADRAFT_46327 [Pachysolen tannophilus NRRL Y-2460]
MASTSHTNDSLNTSKQTDRLKETRYVFENDLLPQEIPEVDEIGATTAPLVSASFYIGARCQPYNDDYMLCNQEAKGTGQIDCLKEGRRVTRCAASVLKDLNKNCSEEFRLHWRCLGQNNLEFKGCRKAELLLNNCVFQKLNLTKTIPGIEEKDQIHLKETPVIKPLSLHQDSDKAYAKAKAEGKI